MSFATNECNGLGGGGINGNLTFPLKQHNPAQLQYTAIDAHNLYSANSNERSTQIISEKMKVLLTSYYTLWAYNFGSNDTTPNVESKCCLRLALLILLHPEMLSMPTKLATVFKSAFIYPKNFK